jgi:hypothetical protein
MNSSSSSLLQSVETPSWMLGLFRSIDELDLSATGGFSVFAEDAHMVFGEEVLLGLENIKKFFAKIDAPMITKHFVGAVWQTGNVYVMQGSADLLKKGDSPDKRIHASPLFNLFWLNDAGRIASYVVSFPPGAGKKAGF